ncbi:NF038122 family metalloprotease [Roseateles saccharophilus]|uniref:Putative secreted protein with PEP-CTERM sorting signal n=1 Tax=Roseateles saccharophilus TaxID=304 RepID=A0A4R3UWJ7_ROSSA|nr:NF038122 family metalloprotease [Roseateles saccharophilus]TCU95400.1 putative secreted protein with PEP-CTERM sorting signal [Roseateles saccharophilus]
MNRKPLFALKNTRAALSATAFAAALSWALPAHANLVITPIFDASITGDTNAAAIEAVINSAASFYDNTFSNPVNISIKFQEGGGLGASNSWVFKARYQNYINRLIAHSSGDATDTTALANLPHGATNPVTGGGFVNVRAANLRAMGATLSTPDGLDGTITVNTHLTDVGSPGTTGQYGLLDVVEHEIDEVLGLGSDVGGTNFFSDPAAEDLFRYDAAGNRTFAPHACGSEPAAYFSLDGSTRLAQFHNCSDGADYGDWASDPLPAGVAPQVQDAYGTPGSHPALSRSSPEVIALDALGYNLVPEPGSLALVLGAVAALGAARRVRRPD